jgi:acyl-CoA synthetase (AMP-forming)/AMP-acid ligase II
VPTAPKNPAEYVISLFGGVRATARALGLSNPSVGYWRRRGYVPMSKLSAILAACRDKGLKVDRQQLIPR